MSTVEELTDELYNQVRIERNAFMMAAHYFDLHIGQNGIHAYYMWNRNQFRFPIWHHIVDRRKRGKRSNKTVEEAVAENPKHFFVSYEDIQGVVTYRDHKEIQLLSTSEQIYFLFREFDRYDSFVAILKEKIPKRYFTRDNVEIEDSVYTS